MREGSKRQIIIAIYGRVSTEHEEQLAALKNQMLWYGDILEKNPNWILYEKYIDEGITGTQAKKRPHFLKMIDDAKAGKFDLIVTREVCRFARNTVETLNYCRELRKIGVGVYFVNDNINTQYDHDEYRLTIIAANAQDESRKISERVKAGQYASRLKGVLYGTGNILGYNRKENTFEIDDEQAETVRIIYRLYLEGKGLRVIKTELLRAQRKNSVGQVKWFESTISRILENPMYIGKQYQKQTTVEDFLEHTIVKNDKSDFVLIQGNFTPIISEEDFRKVAVMKASRVIKSFGDKPTGFNQATDLWMKVLECGCGSRFQQYKWRKDNKTGTVKKGYACRNRILNGSTMYRQDRNLSVEGACDRKTICDWHLELMAKEILESLWGYRKETVTQVFELLKSNFVEEKSVDMINVQGLEKKVAKYKNKINNLLELYTDGELEKKTFLEKKAEFDDHINFAINEMKKIKSNDKAAEASIEEKLKQVRGKLNCLIDFSPERLDRDLIDQLIDKVIVRSNDEYEWFINLTDMKNTDVFNISPNKELSEKKRESIEIRDMKYKLAFESTLSFDLAQAYRKQAGTFLRRNQWSDINFRVYIR